MSHPRHHVPDEELMAYAAGNTCEALSVLVATHLALCPRCRERAADLEAVGGALLFQEHAPVSGGALEQLLGRLDEPPPTPPVVASPVAGGATWLPRPLRDYVGPAGELNWRWVLPGIRQVQVPLRFGEMPVRLMKLSPGITIPKHSHTGVERLLVLTGGFSDSAGHFERGDLSVREGDSAHIQEVATEEPCVALLVAEGPLVPRSFMARVLSLVSSV